MLLNNRSGLSVLAMSLAVLLSGCGEKSNEADKTKTQVAAKVNNDEITVHQLNFEISKLGNLNQAQAKLAANPVLASLVDQQLLVQQAMADKLDRDPQVMQSLEAAKRRILAQALIQKMTANQAAPGEAEMSDYYDKNPALFAERRIYRLQEINIPVTADNIEQVKTRLQETGNLNEFAAWLKSQNIPARAGQSTKTAEQLPLEMLPRLHQLKDGQAMTFTGPGTFNVLVVAGSQTQPLTLEQAKPMIQRYLDNARKRELTAAELKRLKTGAKIEYLGEFADAGKHSENGAADLLGPERAENGPVEVK
jgi:EpsD family peptidyl-prolyl cis-trans isomerase